MGLLYRVTYVLSYKPLTEWDARPSSQHKQWLGSPDKRQKKHLTAVLGGFVLPTVFGIAKVNQQKFGYFATNIESFYTNKNWGLTNKNLGYQQTFLGAQQQTLYIHIYIYQVCITTQDPMISPSKSTVMMTSVCDKPPSVVAMLSVASANKIGQEQELKASNIANLVEI